MEKNMYQSVSMIKALIIMLVISSSFSSCKKKKDENGPVYNMSYKEAILESRKELGAHLISSFTPGMSVCVTIDGEVIWSEGLGYANKELKAPVTRETKFRIGTSSQLFTAFLMAKMEEEGKIDLDESFYTYIPNFPQKDFDFSPRMLAAQAAGFPQAPANEELKLDKKLVTLKDYVSLYENDPQVYEPNTYFLKSNYSWALLGILAEDITETRFPELIKEMVLDTLGLTNTQVDNYLAIIPNRSTNYHRDYIARLVNAPQVNLRSMAPALGFLSTADDLNKASLQLLKPDYFNEQSIKLFSEPYELSTGQLLNSSFGWLVTYDNDGRKVIGQSGNTVGGASAIAIYPEEKLVISMCANLDDNYNELPALQIARHFIDILDPKEEPKDE